MAARTLLCCSYSNKPGIDMMVVQTPEEVVGRGRLQFFDGTGVWMIPSCVQGKLLNLYSGITPGLREPCGVPGLEHKLDAFK